MLKFKKLYNILPLFDWDVYNLKFIIPEIFLFTSLLLLLLYGSLHFRTTKTFSNVEFTAKILLIIFGLTFLLLIENHDNEMHKFLFNQMLAVENFSTTLKIFVILLTAMLVIISYSYAIRNNFTEYEYIIFLGFTTGGMFLILSSFDFMTLLVAIEILSFGLYTLAMIKKQSSLAAEAGIKYLIIGALTTGMYAYGASLFYWYLQSTNFFVLQLHLFNEKYFSLVSLVDLIAKGHTNLLIGIILMVTLLLFKVAAAPFHGWSPDVYEGVPLFVTAYYAVVVKFVMLFTLIKIMYFVLKDFLPILQPGLQALAIASLLIGSIGAVTQNRLKRLFAYSSISHVGYILIGISANSDEGLAASLLYVLVYTVTNMILFMFLLNSDYKNMNSNDTHRVVEIADLAKIGKTHPFFSSLFVVSLLSFAGIPPFAGFFVKLKIFFVAVSAGLYPVVVIAVIASAISCFYYLKLIKAMFFVNLPGTFRLIDVKSTQLSVILWPVLFLTLFIFYSHSVNTALMECALSYFDVFHLCQ
jgi:NADH-quinone oxidoreductase subunit N